MGEGVQSQVQSIGGSWHQWINMFVYFPAGRDDVLYRDHDYDHYHCKYFCGENHDGWGRYIFYFFASILSILTGLVYIVSPYCCSNVL